MSINRTAFTLSAKDVDEVDTLAFDYSAELQGGETISLAYLTCEAKTGNDATPGAVLDGAPQIDGARVLQRVQGGVAGVMYRVRCRAVLTGGRELVMAAWLPVVRLGA